MPPSIGSAYLPRLTRCDETKPCYSLELHRNETRVAMWRAGARVGRLRAETRRPSRAAKLRVSKYPAYLNAANSSSNPCCSGSSMAAAYRASTSSGAPGCGPARSRAPVADGWL